MPELKIFFLKIFRKMQIHETDTKDKTLKELTVNKTISYDTTKAK